MADISSVNLSAQIDALVQQYRTSLRKPITTLEDKKTTLNARMSALTDMKTRLKTLYDTVSGLSQTNSPLLQFYQVNSSDDSIATATAVDSAIVGTHSLLVTQLAKADTVLSNRETKDATDIITAEGAGTKTIRITINGVDHDVSVSLEAGDTNNTVLTKIASAINAADASVSASVIMDTSSTCKLIFRSKSTGSDNAINLTDVSGTLLDNIGLTDSVVSGRTASSSSTAGYVYSSTNLLDAKFTLDNIDVIRQTNKVSDVLSGVTLELKGVQQPSDLPLTLTVEVDKDKIRSSIEKFIQDYNSALSFVVSKTSVNPDKHIREIFAGDQMFLTLRMNLRVIAGSVVNGITPNQLSALGITTAADGTLNLSDSSKLDTAIDNNYSGVLKLFSSTDGIASRLKTMLDSFVSVGGRIDASRDGATSQVKTIDSTISRLNIQIDKKVQMYRDEFVKLQNVYQEVTQQQQIINSILGTG